jgi:crotonobetainyl-CoA:carnitine CoA-transferase CaiB-like acyl-CoA transferase
VTTPGALDGIRVVELSSYISGPYAGMLLADFGAEVIKIEPPVTGDPFRGWGVLDNPFFTSVNRNKKSVVLDLKTPQGQAAARRLTDAADIVIENYRAGALDRLGLGYEDVRRGNPRVIYCSITGFGAHGPYASRPGYDTVGQAMGGLLGLLTDMGDPKPMGVSISDHLAGMVACNGILAALHARERTGQGQRVDTSLLESTVSFIGENATRFLDDGKVPSRATRTHTAQVFAFVDRAGKPFAIHLSSPQKFWLGLLAAIGQPEWNEDPRFCDRKSRTRHYDDLRGRLQAVFATGARADWLARLEREDVPACAINDLKELFEDPQVQALGLVVEVPHPARGRMKLIRNGARLSATPTSVRSKAPELGEHNEELLGEPYVPAKADASAAE